MSRPNPRALMSAQEVVASALANEPVRVVFDTDVPYIDLENKIMHLRPLPEDLTDESVEDVRSDCDHELGHIRYTDRAAFAAITRHLVHAIANSIEDGRIERLLSEEWVGCGENLERSGMRAVARIRAAAQPTLSNCRNRAVCGLSLVSFGRPVDFVIEQLGEDIVPHYDVIAPLLARAVKAKSSRECIEIATAIADTWNWRLSDDRPPEIAAVDPIEFDTPEESENSVAAALGPTSISEVRKRAIRALPADTLSVYRARTNHDRVEVIRSDKIKPEDLLSLFQTGVRQVVPPLRRRLLMKFRDLGRRSFRHRRRGELDERSIHRAALGDERVFAQNLPAFVQRANISLLVDCSTSMGKAAREATSPDEPPVLRSRLFVAAQAAAALCWVLDLLHVRNECLGFTTFRSPVKAKEGFERVRPLRHLIVKPFNQSYHSARKNFVSLGLYEHCSENIDGEAVLWAAQRLIASAKSDARPVLIVLSDGEPASNPENPQVLATHLINSIARAERSGIDVVGVGIGTEADSVRRFYRKFLMVRDVSQLVEKIYVLIEMLLRERAVRRI